MKCAKALFASAILTVADLNFSVNEAIGFQFNIKPKEMLTDRQATIGISLFISYGVFHIYNVIDAIQTVRSDAKKDLAAVRKQNVNLAYKKSNANDCYVLNYAF